MDSQNYDNQPLAQYLLGALPEAQTEECDELSFIDDDFAARLEAVENDLVDAYVRGELTGRDRAAFESYYLASPRRREKVAFAKSLQEFAAQQAATLPAATANEETRAAQSPQDSWWRSFLNLFTIPTLTLQWGMAAAALLMFLAGGWFAWETMRLRGQINASQTETAALQQREKELQAQIEQQRSNNAQTREQLQQELARTQQQLAQLQQQELARQQAKVETPAAEPSLLHVELAPQTRGVGQSSLLTVPAGTDYAVLQLETEDDDYSSYRAELLSLAGDRLLWKSGALKARTRGNSKMIDLKIRAKLLAPGDYVVRLKGVTGNGQVEDIHRYAFKVTKP
ncbi:MAG: hypothetical protein U0Y68_06920 [Blastocatellia bacterium]